VEAEPNLDSSGAAMGMEESEDENGGDVGEIVGLDIEFEFGQDKFDKELIGIPDETIALGV